MEMCNLYHQHTQFCYNESKKLLIAFASDLMKANGQFFSRAFDTKMGRGFTIVGRTGTELKMVVVNEEKDQEGDIKCWHLEPTPECKSKWPRLADIRATVFNT